MKKRRPAPVGPPETKFVYLFRCLEFVKIGVSSDPDKRLSVVNVLCPFVVTKLASILVRDAPRVEWELHRKFLHKWERGEWFRLSIEDIEALIKDLKKIEVKYPKSPLDENRHA